MRHRLKAFLVQNQIRAGFLRGMRYFSANILLAFILGAAQAQTITEFSTGISPAAAISDIAAGPDGNIWFTEYNGNRIGRITPFGVVTEFTAGISAGAGPYGITAGPDGNLWFTEAAGNRIGRITPTGVVTEYSAGISPNSRPNFITAGPDGNLWFTEYNGHRIGRITTSGVVTEFSAGMSPAAFPERITVGPDGALWFTEYTGNRIGRITMAGVITEYSSGISASAGPADIVAGPDGNLWFTEANGNRIGRITTGGVVTEFSAGISADSGPIGIVSGGYGEGSGDGNIWFTEFSGNRLGRISPSGQVTEFSNGISPGAGPERITRDAAGSLWFTEKTTNRIARLAIELMAVRSGIGSGTVTSYPAGIECGNDCREIYPYGKVVTLSAVAAAGSIFSGWSGDCSGTSTCVVTMSASRYVVANFASTSVQTNLMVSLSGNGIGTVSSYPVGISCGSDCGETYSNGTVVSLSAAPASGSTFAGWTGDCNGTGACSVVMNGAKSVVATFTAPTTLYSVFVTMTGTGSGTVSSTPSGINCGTTCTASFNANANVTLTANPAADSTFTGWNGDCTGTGPCTITVNAVRNVIANFAARTAYSLLVTRSGTGSGIVTGSPSGINCGSNCTADYASGTRVALSAIAVWGSTFAGWSGDCTGTGSCVVSLDGIRRVNARFSPAPFPVTTTGVNLGFITDTFATVTSTVSFNATDLGKTGSVFVTAVVPVSALELFGITPRVARAGASPLPGTSTLIYAVSSGWREATDGQVLPYASGVLGELQSQRTILDNVNTTKLAGAQFCVGYGLGSNAAAAEMITAGRMQLVAVVPNPNATNPATGSCVIAPWSIEAMNQGSGTNDVTLRIVFTPDLAERSGTHELYLAGLFDGIWYFVTLQNPDLNIVRYTGGVFPIYSTASSADLPMTAWTVPLGDLSNLRGLQIYTGYGRTADDMLTKDHKQLIFSVQ